MGQVLDKNEILREIGQNYDGFDYMSHQSFNPFVLAFHALLLAAGLLTCLCVAISAALFNILYVNVSTVVTLFCFSLYSVFYMVYGALVMNLLFFPMVSIISASTIDSV